MSNIRNIIILISLKEALLNTYTDDLKKLYRHGDVSKFYEKNNKSKVYTNRLINNKNYNKNNRGRQ